MYVTQVALVGVVLALYTRGTLWGVAAFEHPASARDPLGFWDVPMIDTMHVAFVGVVLDLSKHLAAFGWPQ
jgi:hypothetical protein